MPQSQKMIGFEITQTLNPTYIQSCEIQSAIKGFSIVRVTYEMPPYPVGIGFGIMRDGIIRGFFSEIRDLEIVNDAPFYLAKTTDPVTPTWVLVLEQEAYRLDRFSPDGVDSYKKIVGPTGKPELHVVQKTIWHDYQSPPSPFAL